MNVNPWHVLLSTGCWLVLIVAVLYRRCLCVPRRQMRFPHH